MLWIPPPPPTPTHIPNTHQVSLDPVQTSIINAADASNFLIVKFGAVPASRWVHISAPVHDDGVQEGDDDAERHTQEGDRKHK